MKNIAANIGIGLIRLVSFLPLSWTHTLGKLIGKLLWFTDTARVTKINLRLCYPHYSEQKIESLARESLISLGRLYAEMGISFMWPVDKVQDLIVQVEGLEYLEKAMEEKKGIIFNVPHLGNWEVMTIFFRRYFNMTAMYKPAKIPALNNFIYKTRGRVGVNLVPADASGVKSLYRELKNKGIIGVLPDQEPGLSGGVFAPFFGRMALTGKLVCKMANKTPAAVLFAYAKRLEDGRFCVVIKPGNEDIRNSDEVVAATALNASIEECVNECPEQYQWNYKRFRRHPKGRSHYYKK